MLEAKGFHLDRVRGSHDVFEKPGAAPMIVPVHHGKVKYVYFRKIQKLE